MIETQKERAAQFDDESDLIDAYVACGGQGSSDFIHFSVASFLMLWAQFYHSPAIFVSFSSGSWRLFSLPSFS